MAAPSAGVVTAVRVSACGPYGSGAGRPRPGGRTGGDNRPVSGYDPSDASDPLTSQTRARWRTFVQTETGSAALLLAAVVVALLWANMDPHSYEAAWGATFTIGFDTYHLALDVHEWINAGLMSLFFFVVGLEARREFDMGDLRDRRWVVLCAVAGLGSMVAPVRPTLKAAYPLQDFATYCAWRRADGTPFDPWLRTHEAMGATIIGPAMASQTITGTLEQWQRWTGMRFPASACYAIPGALAPLDIDLAADTGICLEPNLWMEHPL